MKFIEGGIYTNKDDDIWVCLFEKDSGILNKEPRYFNTERNCS